MKQQFKSEMERIEAQQQSPQINYMFTITGSSQPFDYSIDFPATNLFSDLQSDHSTPETLSQSLLYEETIPNPFCDQLFS
jgi:hypothetical protein